MTLAEHDILVAPAPHRWHFDDFMRASEGGVLGTQHVELLEGELIDRPGQKDPHAWAVSRLVHEMRRIFPDPCWIKIQATLRLNDYSAPEPDIAVMSGPPSPPADIAPTPLLIVEVSETTLNFDLGRKASLYAANGIADYWVADVIARQVHVHRSPIRDASQPYQWGFNHVSVLNWQDRVVPLARPDAVVDIAAFLG